MPPTESQWKKYELLLENFQAVGKSQTFFINVLIGLLFAVWSLELVTHSGDVTVQFLGASIQVHGFWKAVPLVFCVLLCGVLGSINLTHHAWRRLDLFIPEVFEKPGDFFFTEFDPHKNILDYLAALTWSLKKPILPDVASGAEVSNQRWDFRLMIYPAFVLVTLFSIAFSLQRVEPTVGTLIYVMVCYSVAALSALPIMWRKTCLFLGVHDNAYDGVDWGTEGYYNMTLEALSRLVRSR